MNFSENEKSKFISNYGEGDMENFHLLRRFLTGIHGIRKTCHLIVLICICVFSEGIINVCVCFYLLCPDVV